MTGIVLVILVIFLAVCFAFHRPDYPLDSSLQTILALKPKKISKKR